MTASGAAQHDELEFAERLLAALARMATRSKRGQADLTAALRAAGIAAEPRRVRAALRVLSAQGDVGNFVPLSDGGLLMNVTVRRGKPAAETSEWLPFEADGGMNR